MKSLSCISLSKTTEDRMKRHPIPIGSEADTDTHEPGHKNSKLQILIEVLKCELGKPGRPSALNTEFEPTEQWTPLYYAVYCKRDAALLHFLRAGQTPDGSPSAHPPLLVAVVAGHVNGVRILCEAGADINATCAHNGETALHLAVKYERNDVLGILLRHKPNLNTRTLHTHETPLHYAAARSGSTNSITALLQHGANYEALNSKGCTPAEVALQTSDLASTITIIRTAGNHSHKLAKEKRLLFSHVMESHHRSSLDINLVAQVFELACPPDSTALVEAIKRRDANVVRNLLNKGANPGEATASGLYPIFAAFNACSPLVVQALVEHGADVTLRNPHGPNVLQAALSSPLSRDKKAITEVFELLLARGADTRATYSDGTTLLHHAIRPGLDLVKVAQLLLKHGVSIDAQDHNGNTALHVAAISPSCVAVLLKHGASPDSVNGKCLTPLLYAIKSVASANEPDLQQLLKVSNIRKADTIGKTALHLAAQNGWGNAVKLLLEARADTTSTDSKKRTPLLLAVLNHQWAIVPFLAAQPGINSWDESGLTALHHIAMSSPKAASTWKDIAAAASSFCEKGVSRSMRDQTGSTPLIRAVKTLPEEGLPVIEVLLCQKGSERSNCVAHEDHDQRNALYYAATLRKLSFVEALLRHGAPFSLSEWTPEKGPIKANGAASKRVLKLFAEYEWIRHMGKLHRQSYTSNDESLLPKVLPIPLLNNMLTMGLDPNNVPRAKPTGSLLWVLLDNSVSSPTFLSEYIYDALKLLFAYGADPNALSSRKPACTPKMRNSQQGPLAVHPLTRLLEQCPQLSIDLVKLMLDNGAKMSIASPLYDDRYPLHSAVRARRLDIADEMLHQKADLDCRDGRQRTPLLTAAESASHEIVDRLLYFATSVDMSDCEGNSPLHIAVAAGSIQVVSSLLRAGAKVNVENHKGLTPLRCLSSKLTDEEKQNMTQTLEEAQNLERRQTPHKASALRAPNEDKMPKIKKPAVNKGRKVLKKSQNAPVQPATIPTDPPPAQLPILALPTMTKSAAPPVPHKDVLMPLHRSKKMISICYTPSAEQLGQSTQTILSAPKLFNSTNNGSQKPRQTPRVDSGLDLSKATKESPLPLPEKIRASYDTFGDFPTETDELKSWLSASKMLDSL